MFRQTKAAICAASFGLTTIASLAAAQGLEPERAQQLREGHMKLFGANLGILGGMAQGKTEYDAEAAGIAASNLVALASVDQGIYWVEGSSTEDLPDSRALPSIWQSRADFDSKIDDLHQATMKMAEVAGTDLAALQGQMKMLGEACGSCHEDYRKPDE